MNKPGPKGQLSPHISRLRTPTVNPGETLGSTYGSEGWGFESVRARHIHVVQSRLSGRLFCLSDPREEIERCRGRTCRRGFATAAEAGRARQDFLDEQEATPPSAVAGLTVTELVTRYLDDYEATERLSPKSLFDYRHYLDDYITPWIGSRLVREIDAETIASWQVNLATAGGKKKGKGLSPNTIRLARAPLNGAFKDTVSTGLLPANPLLAVPRPKARKAVPKHWSPEQARHFLALYEGDRLYPVWAFLLGSGLRIGELVFLRWPRRRRWSRRRQGRSTTAELQ